MSQSVIARRYAKALFEVGKASDDTQQMVEALQRVASANQECPDLLPILSRQDLPTKKRHAIVVDLAAHLSLSPMLTHFLQLLIDKRRMDAFEEIVTAFQTLLDEANGVVTAIVTTATPIIDSQVLSQIESLVSRRTQRRVRVEAAVDTSLIGGVRLRVGDEVIDGSVMKELQRLREDLLRVEM
jgi:F-type H+-transporting ATPase subunit delta